MSSPDFSISTLLYGGSFDPLHEGHLHVAKEVKQQLATVRQLLFVPAARSPGKPTPQASAQLRLRWLKLCAGPYGFDVWDTELLRGGESFTVDTLEEATRLGAARDRLFWLVGADAYLTFPHWRSPERIRELCRLVVVDRLGQPLPELHADDLFVAVPPHPASSSKIRADLGATGKASWLPEPVKRDLDLVLSPANPYASKS